MALEIRTATPADFARVVAIENTSRLHPGTLAELEYWERTRPPAWPVARLVAASGGEVVGVALAGRVAWVKPTDMFCSVVVHPGFRRQGVGAGLYGHLQPLFREHQPTTLRASVLDSLPDALRWAEVRGFARQHHLFNATMDLSSFDPVPLAGHRARVQAAGFRFVHFDAVRTAETEYQLWQLWEEYMQDVPDAADRHSIEFAEWRKWALESPSAYPEGIILAVDAAGNWAGLSALTRNLEEPDRAHISLTAVGRAYRGRGLALALKLVGVEFARARGIARIGTNNHSANGPMLAVNARLGYVPEPGTYLLAKPYATRAE